MRRTLISSNNDKKTLQELAFDKQTNFSVVHNVAIFTLDFVKERLQLSVA
jgi:hypothetical protein